MNRLIAWWARNTVAANLLMFLILIAGLLTFFQLEREEFPNATTSSVEVSVSWPGAGPQEVVEQVVLRLEESVSDLDGVKQISSTAYTGGAGMTVEMQDGYDFDAFLQEVKNRVDAISNLPRDSFPPVVRQLKFNTVLSYITFSSELPDQEHFRLARRIRDEIAGLPGGTPVVDLWGAAQEEVSIEVSEVALRRYGLTFSDVARAIRASSFDQSAGSVRTEQGDVPLAVRNLADNREEFERIVIRQNQDGSLIRVGDVAQVIDGFTERNFISTVNGKPAVTIAPRAPDTINIVKISDVIQGYIERKRDELPPSAELFMNYDTVESYRGSLNLVGSNALVGLALVLVVLALFLRPIVAFWVAAGIGISFMGTFIFLPAVGVSLNFLSLFGMLLVIGIVVDDALVVGESIHRQTERGKKGLDAAVIGTQIVAKPVLFAVLTTIIAFAPFIVMGGGASQFTKHIAWTITFALVFSLIESFLILPAHLSHLKPPDRSKAFTRFQSSFADAMNGFADRVYRPIIKTAIAARYMTVAAFVSLFMIAIALVSQSWVKFNFMPEIEGDFFSFSITMQEGTPFARNKQVYDQLTVAMEETARELEETHGVPIVETMMADVSERDVDGRMILLDANVRPVTVAEVQDVLRANLGEIPDAEDLSFDGGGGGPSGNRVYISIEGRDADQLAEAAADIRAYLGTIPEVFDVRDNLQAPNDELRLKLRPGAERFGLTLQDVIGQVRQAFYGEEVQRLPRGGEDVRVMVRYPREQRENIADLGQVRIRTPDGREVPLSAVAEEDFAPSVRWIRRIDRKQSVSIFGRLVADADQGQVYGDLYGSYAQEFASKFPDVTFSRRGAAQEQSEFNRQLRRLYAIAFFCMYMLLAIAFGSYFQPILIMSAIPFGYMGAVFGHAIWGVPFAMFSFFGVGAAAGVVVNDNLVLIDYVNRLRKEGAGAFAALVEAGVVRFRPIILTSVTTFIGLVPILFESSINAQLLKPMVVSLAFGVLFALFVTLIFVPALYAVGTDIARFYRGLWTGEPQPRLGYGDSQNPLPDIEQDEIGYGTGGPERPRPAAPPAPAVAREAVTPAPDGWLPSILWRFGLAYGGGMILLGVLSVTMTEVFGMEAFRGLGTVLTLTATTLAAQRFAQLSGRGMTGSEAAGFAVLAALATTLVSVALLGLQIVTGTTDLGVPMLVAGALIGTVIGFFLIWGAGYWFSRSFAKALRKRNRPEEAFG